MSPLHKTLSDSVQGFSSYDARQLENPWCLIANKTSKLVLRVCRIQGSYLILAILFVPAGSLDPHRSTDDPNHTSPRDSTRASVQRVARQPENMAAARNWCPPGRPWLLHVSSEHQPHDQPSGVPASCRLV